MGACGHAPRSDEGDWPPGTPIAHFAIELRGEPIGSETVRRAPLASGGARVEHVQRYRVQVRGEAVAWSVAVRGEVDDAGRIRRVEVQRAGAPRPFTPDPGARVYWLDEAAPLLRRVSAGEPAEVQAFLPALGQAATAQLAPDGPGRVAVDAGITHAVLVVDASGRVHGTRAGTVEAVEVAAPAHPESPPDLLALLRIPVAPWPGARHAGQATWHVQGLPAADLDFPPWQRATGGEVVVRRPLPAEIPREPEPPGRSLAQWLGPEPGIAVGTPALREEAAAALVGATGARARIAALVHHVHQRIGTAVRPGLPDAERALRSGQGDCNEHAAALVALARTAGIPARPVTGWVYLDEGIAPGLYPHAWAELWVGGALGWIPVDPVLDEVVADAGHLRVREGVAGILRPTVTLGEAR